MIAHGSKDAARFFRLAMRTNGEIVPSLDRVQRTLAVDVSYTISRMKVLERLPGNRSASAIDGWINGRSFDVAFAVLLSRGRLRAGHEPQIEQLVSWYRDHGIKPRFEMVPGHYEATLGRELVRLGFFQSGFHVSLIGEPADLAHARIKSQ